MGGPRYDDREARAVLGPCAEALHPSAAAEAKRDAAHELLAALAQLQVAGIRVVKDAPGRVEVRIGDGAGHSRPLFVAVVEYDDEAARFTVSPPRGKAVAVPLAFDHAEQRWDGASPQDGSEPRRPSAALGAIARAIASMVPKKPGA